MDNVMNMPRVIENDTAVRSLLKNLGLDDYLNREGVTEVVINRPFELFLETSAGFERIEDTRLTFKRLMFLANALAVFNDKAINEHSPMHSVTLPDGERGHIMFPPTCESHTIMFAFRKPSTLRIVLLLISKASDQLISVMLLPT